MCDTFSSRSGAFYTQKTDEGAESTRGTRGTRTRIMQNDHFSVPEFHG